MFREIPTREAFEASPHIHRLEAFCAGLLLRIGTLARRRFGRDGLPWRGVERPASSAPLHWVRRWPPPGIRVSLPPMNEAFRRLKGARITGQAPARRLVLSIRTHCPLLEIECHAFPHQLPTLR